MQLSTTDWAGKVFEQGSECLAKDESQGVVLCFP